MTASEFSRTVNVGTIGEQPRRMSVEAEPEERQALAKRFGLVAIDRLTAEAALVCKNDDVQATGRVAASVTQSCVATGVPLEQRIDEPFDIRFRPQPGGDAPDDEVELSEAELDVIFYEGASVDIGEAVAETLSLALDPYPRAPGAEEALKAAGVLSEEEAGPFGALAALRDKLKNRA